MTLYSYLQHTYQTWIKKRCVVEHRKQLKHGDVFIFIYRYGVLYVCLMALTLIAGVNYANNLILGFCFLISSIFCLSFYLTFKQLHGLTIELVVDEVGMVGEELVVQIVISHIHPINRYLYLLCENQRYPVWLSQTQTEHRVNISFTPHQRGRFELPIIKMISTYPFGLVQTWTFLYHSSPIWIAPKAIYRTLDNKTHTPQFILDVDEFRELRQFQQGDSYQAVSWRQLALGQGLFVKLFEKTNKPEHIEIVYDHVAGDSHEERLGVMMGLVQLCHRETLAYAMHLSTATLPTDSGVEHYRKAKLLLAQA